MSIKSMRDHIQFMNWIVIFMGAFAIYTYAIAIPSTNQVVEEFKNQKFYAKNEIAELIESNARCESDLLNLKESIKASSFKSKAKVR